jgi:histidine triad (HIT) family protein
MDCVFCRIARKEIPSTLLHDDPDVVAFEDIHPRAKVHVLVVPKRHLATANELGAGDEPLAGRLLVVASEIAKRRRIDSDGYRLIVNCNRHGGQEVLHLHLHLLGGEPLGAMISKRPV